MKNTKNHCNSICVYRLAHTSLGGVIPIDTLFSSTSITLDRMLLVVFNSVGRREVPLVSVATISWVVSEALPSKISAVVLFVENTSSACRIESPCDFSATKIKHVDLLGLQMLHLRLQNNCTNLKIVFVIYHM